MSEAYIVDWSEVVTASFFFFFFPFTLRAMNTVDDMSIVFLSRDDALENGT